MGTDDTECEDTASYNLIAHPQAENDLNAVPSSAESRIRETLNRLATIESPTNHPKCIELTNASGLYRIRIGDWRVILALEKPNLILLIVDSRKTVYRQTSIDLAESRM